MQYDCFGACVAASLCVCIFHGMVGIPFLFEYLTYRLSPLPTRPSLVGNYGTLLQVCIIMVFMLAVCNFRTSIPVNHRACCFIFALFIQHKIKETESERDQVLANLGTCTISLGLMHSLSFPYLVTVCYVYKYCNSFDCITFYLPTCIHQALF